jgi:hypothetical protein
MMNEYEAGLEPELRARPRLRQALEAFREGGPMNDKELQAALPTDEWRTSKGVPFTAVGMEVRTVRRRLAELGLIQPAGTEKTGAAIYKATPTGQVEAAARKFANAIKRGKQRKPRGQSAAAKLAEMRRMVPGEWSRFDRTRRTILRLGPALEAIQPMAFWEAAPPDELDWVRQEIEDLVEWGQQALEAIKTRKDDDATREKISKLRDPNTSGRTEHEIANARRLADKLAERLP